MTTLSFTEKELKRLAEAVEIQFIDHRDTDMGYESRAVQNRHLFVWKNLLAKILKAL